MRDLSIQKKPYRRYVLVFTGLVVAAVAVSLLALMSGSIRVSVPQLLATLFGSGDIGTVDAVVLKIRLPRLLLGLVLGGALAVSGYLLQTYFDNPIAGPYVLGISSGAKMTVSVAMVFFLGRYARVSSLVLVMAAFAGALLVTGFVLLVSRRTEHASALLVAGIMAGYVCSAVSEFVITFAEDADIANLHGWSQGSFASADMGNVAWAFAIVLPVMVVLLFLAKPIGALQLGESHALSVGVNVRLMMTVVILVSGLLSATVTAFAGPISFVGIAVPILIRRALSTFKPLPLLCGCFLGGAVACAGCDLIARSLFSPLEMQLSAVTAIFGAPVVIVALVGRRLNRV